VNDDPKNDPPESEDGHSTEEPSEGAEPSTADRSAEENGGDGSDESVEQREVYTSQELEYLLDRFKSMAFLLTGDPEAETECSYCHQPVALGEALLTAHVAGVLAHIQCPAEHLEEVMQAAQPQPGFDFDAFVQAVDQRLGTERPEECHGVINVPDETESPH
jgi:hypothetical protein